MILDIALGIVLAVVMLRYWPAILAMGICTAIGAIVLAIAGVAIYVVTTNEVLLKKIAAVAALLVAYVASGFVARLIAKRTVLTGSEVGILLTIVVFMGSATVFFFWLINTWAMQADDPILYLYLVPILALWAGVWLKLSSLLQSRRVAK